jgi:hypothetical protein
MLGAAGVSVRCRARRAVVGQDTAVVVGGHPGPDRGVAGADGEVAPEPARRVPGDERAGAVQVEELLHRVATVLHRGHELHPHVGELDGRDGVAVLVHVPYQWHEQHGAAGWPATDDPAVAAALRKIHKDPQRQWTVGRLGAFRREYGVSPGRFRCMSPAPPGTR